MDNDYTLDSLISKFKDNVEGRWHSEGRIGNDGSAGNTLEDLLGVEENNLKLPDFGEIELKTKRKESSSLVTLLHREPQPNASIPLLLTSLGWKHSKAGTGNYPENEMSFRSTTRANSFSDRGFCITLHNNRISLHFDPSEVAVDTKDRTGIYATYGDWLADIQQRQPDYTTVLPVFWEQSYIENEIKNKLDSTLLCLCKTRNNDGHKEFYYESAILLKGFIPANMYKLFDEQALYVDFDARTGHNHGTKFRIDLKSIDKLFTSSVQLI